MNTRSFRGTSVVRFGAFELDVRAAELRKGQEKVRLQEQPFRILTMLLERPGEVVLREEICKRLWPNGTVVEVSHGINAAVLRLRDALGDSADSPMYVETVARRGYRFLAQVEVESRRPAPVPRAATSADSTGEFPAGQAISHFRVQQKLGSGGMGVVYRAEDVNLSRPVALKFLAPDLAGDPMAVSRFQREARTASALNHPNICTVYAVEECGGQPVIVMELLEGRTLESLLADGPLPLERALPLSVQMAAALEAAHRKGIVHRDLKPGNVMVTQFGVKVLDFGLAKQSVSGACTGSGGLTHAGSIVGTPNYMAPEQFQGKEADARSDIYSFGLVLFEMLAGARADSGRRLPAEAADLEPLVRRALELRPEDRWQNAGDLRAALDCVAAVRSTRAPVSQVSSVIPSESQAVPKPPTRLSRRARYAIAAAVLATVAVAAAYEIAPLLRGQWPELHAEIHLPVNDKPPMTSSMPPVTKPQITPIALRKDPVSYPLPATRPPVTGRINLSPDGKLLAFASGGEIYVRTLDGSDTRLVASNPGMAGTPFWSPDGESLAFTNGGHLYVVPLKGGSARSIGQVNTNIAGAWGPDGTILIGEVRDGLLSIPSAGGEARKITRPESDRGETRHMAPVFLPGGRKYLYTAGSDKVGGSMLYAGSLDSSQRIAIMPVESGVNFVPQHGSKGVLVFTRRSDLMAQPFDAVALRTEGDAVRLGGPVNFTHAAAASATSIADFSAAAAALVYHSLAGARPLMSLASASPMRALQSVANGGEVMVMENWLPARR